MSKTKKILNSFILGLIFVNLGSGCLYANEKTERNWGEGKNSQENKAWEGEIERWDNITKEWVNNRASLHKQYYNDDFMGVSGREYCDNSSCWNSGLMDYTYKSLNGSENWSMDNEGMDLNATFSDGTVVRIVNDGQSIEMSSAGNETWNSSNRGQIIIYKNSKGDNWETRNTGQVVEFKGANGESWTSTNFGQNVEHTDASGKKWIGSDDDTADNMRK